MRRERARRAPASPPWPPPPCVPRRRGRPASLEEPRYDPLLERPHRALYALLTLRVLLAQHVQGAVHGEAGQLLGGGHAVLRGLAQRLLVADVDVAHGQLPLLEEGE